MHCIIQLLLCVFILHDPLTVTIAAHINADTGIAAFSEIGVGEAVACRGPIAFAIGQEFQYCRHRVDFGICRHPYAGRQAAPIRHDNRHVRQFGNWQQIVDAHGHASPGLFLENPAAVTQHHQRVGDVPEGASCPVYRSACAQKAVHKPLRVNPIGAATGG